MAVYKVVPSTSKETVVCLFFCLFISMFYMSWGHSQGAAFTTRPLPCSGDVFNPFKRAWVLVICCHTWVDILEHRLLNCGSSPGTGLYKWVLGVKKKLVRAWLHNNQRLVKKLKIYWIQQAFASTWPVLHCGTLRQPLFRTYNINTFFFHCACHHTMWHSWTLPERTLAQIPDYCIFCSVFPVQVKFSVLGKI